MLRLFCGKCRRLEDQRQMRLVDDRYLCRYCTGEEKAE